MNHSVYNDGTEHFLELHKVSKYLKNGSFYSVINLRLTHTPVHGWQGYGFQFCTTSEEGIQSVDVK
jgi:hypothetical protein